MQIFVVNLWYFHEVFVVLLRRVISLQVEGLWDAAAAEWEKAAHTASPLGKSGGLGGLWPASLEALAQAPTSSSLYLWNVPQPSKTAPPAVDHVLKPEPLGDISYSDHSVGVSFLMK